MPAFPPSAGPVMETVREVSSNGSARKPLSKQPCFAHESGRERGTEGQLQPQGTRVMTVMSIDFGSGKCHGVNGARICEWDLPGRQVSTTWRFCRCNSSRAWLHLSLLVAEG